MGSRLAIGHAGSKEKGGRIEKKKLFILALGAAALATLGKAGGVSLMTAAPAPPNVVTRCAVVETGSVDGFVSNQGSDPQRLRGEVRFVFTSDGSSSRPDQLVQSDVELPPGKPVRVARARLNAPLRPGEECRLDVEASLRPE